MRHANDLLDRSEARASPVFVHLRGPLISRDRRAGHVQVVFYTLMAPSRERDPQNRSSASAARMKETPPRGTVSGAARSINQPHL